MSKDCPASFSYNYKIIDMIPFVQYEEHEEHADP